MPNKNEAKVSEQALQCRAQYRTPSALFTKFSVEVTETYVANYRDRMMFGTAPTLSVMKEAFGNADLCSWIQTFLVDAAVWFGISGKVIPQQIIGLSEKISTKYKNYKATELMLFFSMYKAGDIRDEYGTLVGKMYGTFDAQAVMDALACFSRYRVEQIVKREAELNKHRIDESQCITYDEFVALQKLNNNGKQKNS